jgi:predicted site-specific integrase-resolvase
VSSNAQKPELKNQVIARESFCLGGGLSVEEWRQEIAGGLNFKRKKFLNLIFSRLKGEVEILVVAHYVDWLLIL